jgi:hypothetical protein
MLNLAYNDLLGFCHNQRTVCRFLDDRFLSSKVGRHEHGENKTVHKVILKIFLLERVRLNLCPGPTLKDAKNCSTSKCLQY